ncbi:MAG TPA: hypothetical protein VIA09_03125 [Nitrososphaeraceae archaeon]|jgi:hypothetical protein
MQRRPVIFVVATVLLVPFVYGFSVVPDICALPPDPKWGKQGDCWYPEKNSDIMICCWEIPDPKNPGKTQTACQTCDTSTKPKDCGDVVVLKPSSDTTGTPEGGILQEPASPTGNPQGGPQGGVLQDPSTDSGPKLPEKGGFSLGPNLKSSQANVSSNNSSR